MRYTIWKRDDFFASGFKDKNRIDMDADVVELPEKANVVWNFDLVSPPVGRATDIRLEDGEITCELVFLEGEDEYMYSDQLMKDFDLRLGGHYAGVIKSKNGKRVTACRLKAVSIMLKSNAPGWGK